MAASLPWAAVDRFLLLLSSHGWSPHEGHEHEFGAYCTQCFEDLRDATACDRLRLWKGARLLPRRLVASSL